MQGRQAVRLGARLGLRHALLLCVEITTDEGVTGWGECYGPAAVAKTFIDTQYKARVVGRDPFDVEAIWEDLYNRIKDYGTTGMAISAISGIDIALWDIMGRAVNKPVHKLIGGAYRSEGIPYATGLYFMALECSGEGECRGGP